MSKAEGPAANSFESPRKMGWLYKQGGSGVTSHWRKRWFVADHHYLFYYKKPDDKSPVGILCLPEYDSCHKSEGKEWKKPNTFLLDKGSKVVGRGCLDQLDWDCGEATDSSSKSYVLHSDTEEEMLEWIEALKEEMKPMVNGNKHEMVPNGRDQTTPTKASKIKRKTKSESSVKIDSSAFNELSELAAETPKLTHLTAARPKVRNRRPPKKYAVFHEDDTREDESPPPTPTLPPTQSSPSHPKKGHRPSVPIMPKPKPLTPPKASKSEISPCPEVVADDVTPEIKKRPTPPRKPSKDRPPPPPSKPSKSNIEISLEATEPPTPVKKPRPQPPVKPRTSTATTPTDIPPAPKPRPRKRITLPGDARSEEETIDPSNEATPTDVGNEETTPTDVGNEETTPTDTSKEAMPTNYVSDEVTLTVPISTEDLPLSNVIPNEVIPTHAISPSLEEKETTPTTLDETTPTTLDETTPTTLDDVPNATEPCGELSAIDESSEVTVDKPETNDITEVTNNAIGGIQPDPIEKAPEEVEIEIKATIEPGEDVGIYEMEGPSVEQLATDNKVTESAIAPTESADQSVGGEMVVEATKVETKEVSSGDESMYEDMEMGAGPPTQPTTKEEESSGSEYENMEFEQPVARHSYDMVPTETFASKTVDISVSQSGSFVPQPMEMASKGQSTSSYIQMDLRSPLNKDEYVDMEGTVFREKTGTVDYDEPGDWGSAITESPRKTKQGDYDVPRPVTSLSMDRNSPGVVSSSGSTGSRGHSSRKGSKGQSDRLSALRTDGGFDRDRSSSGGSQGYSKSTPPLSPLDSAHAVPGTLRQAKEILRLAHMIRAEADEMRDEAKRELELARRERHDAELLKKNAAQILKMAKERLSDSKAR